MVPSAVESYNVSPIDVSGNANTVISVGRLLRTSRERQGKTIPDIATDLCLMQSYLRAIEEDDLASLPGLFFYRSFVRQYAALLGVDTETVMPALNAMTNPPRTEPEAVSPGGAAASTVAKSAASGGIGVLPARSWTAGLLVLALAVCSRFYALWIDTSALAAPVTAAAHSAPKVMPDDTAISPPSNVANETSSPNVAADIASGEAEPAVQLSLSATELTWLSITAQGRQIFSGVLQPSELKTVSGVDAATLKIGNAGGVEVRWNGKHLGPIGRRGEVRTVLLTPGSFEILTPAKNL